MIHTRPDLSFAVGVLSRYMQAPKRSHEAALKQILRCLQGTQPYGLEFVRSNETRVVGYSDSSHNVDEDDGRSTTGHVFFYADSPITWCSQKQETIALSSCEAKFMTESCEAKFMTATAAAKQAIWLQEFLGEITRTECKKVMTKIDN